MLTTSDSRLGSTIDRFRLLSVLGTGSTSVVYLGQRLDDPRALVALKLLNIPADGSPNDLATFRARFLREARAASKLHNEFILPVLSYGDADDLSYMIMPVIVGGTLAVRLTTEKQPLPLDEIARYVTQLAEALEYAHHQGVVHRDVKPSNILLDEHRHVYLTDFGIARIYDGGDNALTREGPLTLTRTGQVLGTPYYMAPEQIKGEPVGPATDIYALGIVIYQLVTGQVPFQGDTPLAVALRHLQETPSSPRLLRDTLPAPIEEVILRALAKDPTDRFASAGALARAFQNGLDVMHSTQASQPMQQAWPFSTGYHLPGAATEPLDGDADHEPPTPQELIGATVDGYHIGRPLDAFASEEIYLARREGHAYRLHVWRAPRDLPAEERASRLERCRERARALATLQAENILPVAGQGDYRGLPYLVTASAPGPSLTDTLDRNGPLSLVSSSTYLGHVAAALAAADQRGILHLNLTTDCIYIAGPGGQERAVVDFAASRPPHDAGATPQPQPALAAAGDAYSPEQIMGTAEGAYTDVYALGSVLFQMLTARPAFTGATRDSVAQQHLRSPAPALRESRTDLPVGIDYVVARAMAKSPAQRYAHPSELAAACRRLAEQAWGAPAFVMARVPEDQGASVGSSGPASTTVASRSPEVARPPERPPVAAADSTMSGGAPPAQVPQQQPGGGGPPLGPSQPDYIPSGASRPPRPRGSPRNRLLAEIASIAVVLGVLGGTLVWFSKYHSTTSAHQSTPIVTAPGATAEARFFDSRNSPGASDGLILDTTNLAAPPAGHVYMAWLLDDATEHIVSLGALVPGDKGFTLTYTPGGSTPGPNLIAFGSHVEITLEQGTVPAPIGNVVLSGVFPPQTLVHVKHLLVSFPSTPGQRGFLVGLLQQTTILSEQAQVLQSFIQRQYFVSAPCAAQNVINVLEGAHGQHYQSLGPECAARNIAAAGDGFGILGSDGYLAGASDHASLAANSPDASAHTRLHAQHIELAVTNITGWLTAVDQDAVSVLGGNHDPNKVQEMVTLVDHALHGTDTNGDESIDPVIGEAGVATAYAHGQLLSSIDLVASKS